MTDYEKGYEAGCKNGYRQGYKEGLEAGRKAAIRDVSENPDISDATRYALFKMGQKAHSRKEDGSCLTCVDGGIDMPYCAECNPKNGFAYFRKKV